MKVNAETAAQLFSLSGVVTVLSLTRALEGLAGAAGAAGGLSFLAHITDVTEGHDAWGGKAMSFRELSLLADTAGAQNGRGAAMGIYNILPGLGALAGSIIGGILAQRLFVNGIIFGALAMTAHRICYGPPHSRCAEPSKRTCLTPTTSSSSARAQAG